MPINTDTDTTEQTQSQTQTQSSTSSTSDRAADLAAGTHDRDPETGELLGDWFYIEEIDGDVKARPLTRSERQKFLGAIDEGEELPASLEAEMFEKKIVAPHPSDYPDEQVPYDEYSEEYIDEGLSQDWEHALFYAILLADGKEDIVEQVRAARSAPDQDVTVEGEDESGNPA